LNGQIQRAQLGGNKANDLLDKRDNLLDQLAVIADAHVTFQSDDTVAVTLDGQQLVQKTTSMELKTRVDANAQLHIETDGGDDVRPGGGQLAGIIQSANVDVASRITALDGLALQLRDDVNALHHTGFTKTGTLGGDFFVGTSAADIRVDSAIQSDVSNVAAS